MANVTAISIRDAGTVSKERQEKKWRLNLQGLTNVVQLFLHGHGHGHVKGNGNGNSNDNNEELDIEKVSI